MNRTRPGRISAIVACDEALLIGANGDLPWHLPGDLKRFKAITMGKPLLMGRATWESIGRPLPGRRNMVLTRQEDYDAPGAEVFSEISSALRACRESEELMVGGGAVLYEAMLPLIDRLYLTVILERFEGNTWFPDFDLSKFEVCELEEHPALGDTPRWALLTLERNRNPGMAMMASEHLRAWVEERISELR